MVSYTLASTRGTVNNIGPASTVTDSANIEGDRGPNNSDRRNALVASASVILPFDVQLSGGFGKPFPKNPSRPVASFKTAWKTVRTKANVQGRFHDCRHTFITRVAESGQAGDETIRDLAGHVSRQMLKHYSHIGMEAKRRAVQALVTKQQPSVANPATDADPSDPNVTPIFESPAKDSPKVEQVH